MSVYIYILQTCEIFFAVRPISLTYSASSTYFFVLGFIPLLVFGISLDYFQFDREWTVTGQLWVQQVSSTPATRLDVVNLQEELDRRLQQRQARETGICPVRRELYSQCFGMCELSYTFIRIIAIFL